MATASVVRSIRSVSLTGGVAHLLGAGWGVVQHRRGQWGKWHGILACLLRTPTANTVTRPSPKEIKPYEIPMGIPSHSYRAHPNYPEALRLAVPCPGQSTYPRLGCCIAVHGNIDIGHAVARCLVRLRLHDRWVQD